MLVRNSKEVGHSNDTVLFDLLVDISLFEFKVNSFVQSFRLSLELRIKLLIQILQLNDEFSSNSQGFTDNLKLAVIESQTQEIGDSLTIILGGH